MKFFISIMARSKTGDPEHGARGLTSKENYNNVVLPTTAPSERLQLRVRQGNDDDEHDDDHDHGDSPKEHPVSER